MNSLVLGVFFFVSVFDGDLVGLLYLRHFLSGFYGFLKVTVYIVQ